MFRTIFKVESNPLISLVQSIKVVFKISKELPSSFLF